jgi:hypothetical protein
MTQPKILVLAIGVLAAAGAASGFAGQKVYTYSVVHPVYGEIGTLTDSVERGPDAMRIESRLRIAVTVLGIVMYRQQCDTTEVMQGNRLVSLQSQSEKDGQHLETQGKAEGGKFVVNGTAGSFTGPANIVPSDPWILEHSGEGTIVYASTGKISKAMVSGGSYETVTVNGASLTARHFTVMGDIRQDVWLDDRGVPVMFRSVEDGTPIDFVLQGGPWTASATQVASSERPALPRPDKGNK